MTSSTILHLGVMISLYSSFSSLVLEAMEYGITMLSISNSGVELAIFFFRADEARGVSPGVKLGVVGREIPGDQGLPEPPKVEAVDRDSMETCCCRKLDFFRAWPTGGNKRRIHQTVPKVPHGSHVTRSTRLYYSSPLYYKLWRQHHLLHTEYNSPITTTRPRS